MDDFKVGEIQRGSGSLVPAGPGSGMPGNGSSVMEASVLLHNITRIVQVSEFNCFLIYIDVLFEKHNFRKKCTKDYC